VLSAVYRHRRLLANSPSRASSSERASGERAWHSAESTPGLQDQLKQRE